MKIYTIYRITNNLNGKVYIGFTSKTKPESRWAEHVYLSVRPELPGHSLLHRAIVKYGADQFTFDILYQSKDRLHTLLEMEPAFITEYDCVGTDGYNVSLGGTAPMLGRKISEKTRALYLARRHTTESKAKDVFFCTCG